MANFAELVADEIIGHTIDLMRVDASIRGELWTMLMGLRDELIEKISHYDEKAFRNPTVREARMRQLLADTSASIKTAYGKQEKHLKERLFDVGEIETNFAGRMFTNLIGVDLASVTLDPKHLKALLDDNLIFGHKLGDWWKKQATDTQFLFAQNMRNGMMGGETVGQLIQRVRGQHTGRFLNVNGRRVGEYTGGILDVPSHQISTLVRTSVQSVANSVRLETMKANDDVIKGYQALATLDSRTSEICRARSGHTWDMEGEPTGDTKEKFPGPPPWHYNCRSTLIPILKSWSELSRAKSPEVKAKVAEMEKKMPPEMQASMDGQVAGDLNYSDWLKTKDVGFQQKVLGPSRWKLWSEGKVALDQMIDQTGNPLSVFELRSKLGLLSAAEIAKAEQKMGGDLGRLITDSRSNGYAVPSDGGLIEDQQILYWEEAMKVGARAEASPYTHALMKVTREGEAALRQIQDQLKAKGVRIISLPRHSGTPEEALEFFAKKDFVKGHTISKATKSDFTDAIRTENRTLYIFPDGTKALHYSDNLDFRAMNNTLHVISKGKAGDGVKATEKAMKAFSIDIASPTPLQAEELYLMKLLRQEASRHPKITSLSYASESSVGEAWVEILRPIKAETDIAKRIGMLKAELKLATGMDVDQLPGYLPRGTYEAFGHGHRVFTNPFRAADPHWQRLVDDVFVYQQSTNSTHTASAAEKRWERLLNSGGKFLSGTERARRNVWATIHGMSTTDDMGTGGADYVFTRVFPKNKAKAWINEGNVMVWKGDVLKRADAITYSGDRYGRTSTQGFIINNHYTDPLKIMDDVVTQSGNETIFKRSLSIFDDLLYIGMPDEDQVAATIKVFRAHGYDRWPDGRALEDVILTSRAVGRKVEAAANPENYWEGVRNAAKASATKPKSILDAQPKAAATPGGAAEFDKILHSESVYKSTKSIEKLEQYFGTKDPSGGYWSSSSYSDVELMGKLKQNYIAKITAWKGNPESLGNLAGKTVDALEELYKDIGSKPISKLNPESKLGFVMKNHKPEAAGFAIDQSWNVHELDGQLRKWIATKFNTIKGGSASTPAEGWLAYAKYNPIEFLMSKLTKPLYSVFTEVSGQILSTDKAKDFAFLAPKVKKQLITLIELYQKNAPFIKTPPGGWEAHDVFELMGAAKSLNIKIPGLY